MSVVCCLTAEAGYHLPFIRHGLLDGKRTGWGPRGVFFVGQPPKNKPCSSPIADDLSLCIPSPPRGYVHTVTLHLDVCVNFCGASICLYSYEGFRMDYDVRSTVYDHTQP